MSQYATETNLADYGLPSTALTSLTTAQKNAFLTQASATIDTYLRAHHTLPISGEVGPPNTYPGELVEACVAIAAWRILVFRGFNPDQFDEVYRTRYEDAMAWLRDAAKGLVNLDPSADATPTTHEGTAKVKTGTSRGWTDFFDPAS